MKPTSDGGYIISGFTASGDGDVSNHKGAQDMWVVKINVDGDIIWEKTFGGVSSEFAQNIECTSDGGFIIAGNADFVSGDITSTKEGIATIHAAAAYCYRKRMMKLLMYVQGRLIEEVPISTSTGRVDLSKQIQQLLDKHEVLIKGKGMQPVFYLDGVPSLSNSFRSLIKKGLL